MNSNAANIGQAALGAVLTVTPLWVVILQDISMIAGGIASICGAIVGIHAVYRLMRLRQHAGNSQ